MHILNMVTLTMVDCSSLMHFSVMEILSWALCSSWSSFCLSSSSSLSLRSASAQQNTEFNGYCIYQHKEMAAKIGVALLEENNLLKEKNIRLEAKLEILEEKVGRMENEENKYLNKIEDLLQNISEIQAQLEREKKLRIDTQNVFEEHDYKQGQLVDNHTKTINHLENTIKNLEKKLSSQETLQSELPNRTMIPKLNRSLITSLSP
ncbi:hypothetical protein J6590_052645 [Homalodisca vitripennis]|nr:hypothetical protein J6590_052645 [Homalodisca vitripennis]